MASVHVTMKDNPTTGAELMAHYAGVQARRRALVAPVEQAKPEPKAAPVSQPEPEAVPLPPATIFLMADEWFPSVKKPPAGHSKIINVVSWHFEVSRFAMLSLSQRARIALPRQVAMYFVRHLAKRSYPEIGHIFGRDHSTVISAVRKIERLAMDDSDMRGHLRAIERELAA